MKRDKRFRISLSSLRALTGCCTVIWVLASGRSTHYQLHRTEIIPGYEDASNTPMKNRRTYIPLMDEVAAIKPGFQFKVRVCGE